MPTIDPYLAHLPVYRGLPVAWVACWTGEQQESPIPVDRSGRFNRSHLPKGIVLGPNGMVMLSQGNQNMGKGTPDFGATQSFRQRSCITRPRCQVCGRVIKGVPWWIIPTLQGDTIWDAPEDEQWTKQPPVCEQCLELAPQWCPALRRQGYNSFQANSTIVAVTGSAWLHNEWTNVWTTVDDSSLHDRVLVREYVVRLTRTGGSHADT